MELSDKDTKGNLVPSRTDRESAGFIWSYTDSTLIDADISIDDRSDRMYLTSGGAIGGEGAVRMGGRSYPEVATSIEGRSVESIRKAILELRGSSSIFHVGLAPFQFTLDLEGRAKLGIALNQLSSFQKDRIIISSWPDSEDIVIPDLYLRSEITRMAVEKGFAWVEYDPEMDYRLIRSLRDLTVRTGSRLMLRFDPTKTTKEEITKLIWSCDALMLSMIVDKRKDLDLLIEAAGMIMGLSPLTPIYLRPRGRYSRFVQSISNLTGATVICIDQTLVTKGAGEKQKQSVLDFSPRTVNLHLGLLERLEIASFSMKGRKVGSPSGFMFMLGNPVHQSLEPILHNRAFKESGKDSFMVPVGCGTEAIDSGISLLHDMEAIGASVTLPIRSLMIKKLDIQDDQVKRLGAVNTIKNIKGQLYGFNTEYMAASDVLGKYIFEKGSKVLILGVGGAGRSIAAASSDMGFKTFLCGSNAERTLQAARSVGSETGAVTLRSVSRLKGKVTLLVNATPEGTNKVDTAIESKMGVVDIARDLEPTFGMDLVYSPPWTSFLSSIESRGGEPISGFEMLASEVIRSHRIWMGSAPSAEEVKLWAMEAHPLLLAG